MAGAPSRHRSFAAMYRSGPQPSRDELRRAKPAYAPRDPALAPPRDRRRRARGCRASPRRQGPRCRAVAQDGRERAAGRVAHRGGDGVQRSRARAAARPRAGKGAASSWCGFPACRARSSWTRSASPRPAAACCASRPRPSSASGCRSSRPGKLLDELDAVNDRLTEMDDRRARRRLGGRRSCARSARRRPSPRRSARGARTWSPTSRRGGRRSTSSASAGARRAAGC